ncbi:MAG: NAD(+) diphosphatase [Treponema sp.]|jgi:NAD+ diphosphatase|nr:NAD(+) diphosphatase [Treponema sp.]
MALISNQNNFFCENHLIFCDNDILLEKPAAQLKQPSELILRKCLDNQLMYDWFAEPDKNYSAMLLENSAPVPAGCEYIPLRQYFAEAGELQAALAARARGILNWRRNTRFCSACGNPLQDDAILTARFCFICKKEFFPVIEPAVIVLVTDGDKLLLVRHKQRITHLYACISGYIEHGESAEQCVHREVKEEVGIEIRNLRYVTSQPWPFPDQLMLGFRAEYKSGELKLQEDEIQEAAWFTRDNLPETPAAGSLAHRLISGEFD